MDLHNLFSMGDFKDVKVEAQAGDKPNQIVLTFKVTERPLIDTIVFKGNKKWDSKKFQDEMKLTPKAPFNQAQLNTDLMAIKKLYLDEGYPYATVDANAEPNANDNVDLIITVNEGSQIKIGGIEVTGAQAFSEDKVASQMKENKKGDKYKPDELDDDLKAIEDFYHDEGYLKAVVLSHEEKLNAEKKRVYISLAVNEGVKYTLGNVKFRGNILFEDSDLLRGFKLKKGDLLRKKDFDDGAKNMRTMYADKGYIYASLAPKMSYDDDSKTADVVFDVTEGQVAYVQDIKIVGNYKTQDYVIRRELEIAPGDKFEAAKIKLSVADLYNLGFFDEINPEVEPGDTPDKEILVFRVKERKTGSISVGGGYSSIQGLVGNVKLEEANLFGKGQHANLDVEFGSLVTSFSVGFTEPWLFNTRTSLSLNLFDTTQYWTTSVPNPDGTNKFYTQSQLGGSISVGRRLSRYWSIFGTYSLQNVNIYDVDPNFSNPTNFHYIAASDTTTSSLTPRIVYDSRDNYFDPTTGWKHQLSIELAGGPLGFDNNFIKIIGDSSRFVPLPLDFVIGEHVKLGAGQGYWFAGRGYTDVPVYEKFFAGGTDTVRGYNERTIGPVSGGNALFVSNTELKHAIFGPLRGVVFFDAGDAWTNAWSLDESSVQFGAGCGIRLTIPGTIMDIRLDYGWPIASNLPASAAPPGGVLHFNLGNLF
jgi:outer membrane protein insertion porin family